MAISFSGLASGLDTSSWVESLVALKQAKIDTLEEQKETVLLSRETLNNIKSFFNSFRSVIEKVTDAKYGVASMDIFAQKLATSSDLNILTASATTEAEEAEYNVLVDNLATSTEAVSGLKVLNTIIETATAVGNTKLVDLGIKVGEIGIDNNGIYNIIQIEKNDTIESFIAKLHNIGVDATYNSKTGIFGINLDDGSIDDTLTIHDDGSVGTGILDIFNLHEKGGYESTYLQTSTSETIVNAATSSTKLSELGSIKAGNIQVKANGTSYNLSIDGNTTLGGLVSSLNSLGVDAKLASNGVLTINDAEIVDSGNTGIITALGLETDINSKTQTASGLKTVVVTTTDAAATGATKLSELGSIKSGNIQVKANGALYTIAISGSTTLQGLIDALSAKGVDASLSSDGVFTVKNAEIIDSGNTGLISALGLQVDVNSKTQSSIDLRTVVTTTTQAAATGATKLSQLGSITNGNMLVKANNTTYTIAINTSTTLQGLIDALKAKGISAELSGDGTLTINDAEIIDNNTGIINALGLEKEVSSKTQTANNLSYKSVITTSSEATSSTKLGDLSVWSKISTSPVLTAKNTSGGTTSITLTSTMTIGDVVTKLNSAGLSAAFSSSGVLAVTGGEVSGKAAEALGIKSGSENTSGVWANGNTLFTQGVNYAVASNTLGELGISTAKPSSGYALAVYNSSNALVKEISVSSSTRIDDIFSALSQYGITGTIDEGKITLKSSNGNYVKGSVADAMGISTITSVIVSSTNASSTSSIKYTVTQVVSGTTTFAQAGLNAAGKVLEIKTKENGVTQAYITIASNSTTFDSMFSSLSKYGFSAAINDGVITLSSSQYIVGGSMAELLGIETYATSDAYTVGEAVTSTAQLTYTATIVADSSSLIKDYISLDSNSANNRIRIYKNNDLEYVDFTVTSSTTFGQLMSAMEAQGISVSMSNGVLSFNTPQYGAHAEDIPASGGILSKLGIGKKDIGDITVPLSQTSTMPITYTTYKNYTLDSNSTTTLGELVTAMAAGTNYTLILNTRNSRYVNGRYEDYDISMYTMTVTATTTWSEFYNALRYSYNTWVYWNSNNNTMYLGSSRYSMTGTFSDLVGWTTTIRANETITAKDYTGGEVQAYVTNSWSMTSSDKVYYTIITNGSASATTITANTTFVQLGLHDGGSSYQTYNMYISGKSKSFTIRSNTTVGDFMEFIKTNGGPDVTLKDGKLSFSSNGEKYLSSINSQLRDRFNLPEYGSFTYGITSIRQNTTMNDILGISSGVYYLDFEYYTPYTWSGGTGYESGYQTFSLNSGTTMAEVLDFLNNTVGVSATLVNGKLSIKKGSGGNILKDIRVSSTSGSYGNPSLAEDFKKALKIEVGKGYTYTASGGNDLYTTTTSKTLGTASAENLVITAETKLTALGFDYNRGYEILSYRKMNSATSFSNSTLFFTVNSSSTVGDLLAYINSNSNFNATLKNGKLTITGKKIDNNNMTYITRYNSIFQDIFKLEDAGNNVSYKMGDVYQNTNSKTNTRVGDKKAENDSQTLRQLGLKANATISMNNTEGNVTWKIITPDMTLIQFNKILGDYGVSARYDNSSGKLIIGSLNDTEWVESISDNLKSVLKLKGVGTGYTYQVIGNAAYENTSSRTIKTVTTHTATATTTLEQIDGFQNGNGNILVHKADGSTETLYVDSTSTLQDFFNQIAAYGLKGSINSAGVVTITGNGNTFLSSASGGSNLVSLLKLSLNKTSTTGTVNTTTGTISSTAQVIATKDTLLGNLAYANGTKLTFDSSGFASLVMQTKTREGLLKNFTVNFSKTSTLGSVLDAFKAQGLNASIDATGRFSVSTDSLSDFNISGALGTYLMGASYNKSYETKGGTPLSASSVNTVTAAATRETKLADLGVTTGEYNIYNNGVKFTAQISSDETLGSFIDTLSSFGIQAGLINNGSTSKLIITGSGNSYIAKSNSVSNSSNVVEKLFGSNTTADSYKYTGKEILTSTSTSTQAADSTALLSAYGVTAGEYYIYTNGNRHTLQISSDETLGSFMNTLKSFGIQTGLINNGSSASLVLIGNGNSYVAKSNSVSNASNVVEKLFGTAGPDSSFSYTGSELLYKTVTHTATATEDTLLSTFDTPWGDTTLKSAGNLALQVDGKNIAIQITDTETFGSLIDKLEAVGVQASFVGGKLYISEMNGVSILANGTTSSIINPNANIHLAYKSSMDGFMESTSAIVQKTTIIEDKTLSAANYAGLDTQLKTLNITGGTFSIFRNGEKATINVNSDNTFDDLRSQIASRFSDVDLKFEEGKLVIYSKDDDVELQAGTTTDTSNLLAVTGLAEDEEGRSVSARALYCVNESSVLTQTGLFRKGDVKEGTFYVGDQMVTITNKSTLSDIISQINSSDTANATAYWDSINGRLVIKSRSTGQAFINIEAGTSNFTDIMGYTETEWYTDGSVKKARMVTDSQNLGENSKVSINGTTYTSTSNILTSDITRIKGLTINLNGLTSGSAVKLTVEKDKETVANSLSDIVDSYNELMKNVDEAVAKDGSLKNQTTLKMLRNQIRSAMMSSIGNASVFKNLDAIGISVTSASANNVSTSNESIINLTFDKDKFLDAYEADSDAVKELLIGSGIKGSSTATDGVFTKVESIVENSLQSVIGYFSIADAAYAREINKIDNKIVSGNEAIEKYRARLNKKFNSMDMLISNMQNQYSSFLS